MTRTPPPVASAGRLADFQKNTLAATTPMEVLNQTEEAVALITESAKHVDANLTTKLSTLAQALRRESNKVRGLKPMPDLIIDIEEGADLTGPDLTRSDLTRADLTRSDLTPRATRVGPGNARSPLQPSNATPQPPHSTLLSNPTPNVTLPPSAAGAALLSANAVTPGATLPATQHANALRGLVVSRASGQVHGPEVVSIPMPADAPARTPGMLTVTPASPRAATAKRSPPGAALLAASAQPSGAGAGPAGTGAGPAGTGAGPAAVPGSVAGQLRPGGLDEPLTTDWGRASFDLFEPPFQSQARDQRPRTQLQPGSGPGPASGSGPGLGLGPGPGKTRVPAYLKPTAASTERSPGRKPPPPGQQPPAASPAAPSPLSGSGPSSSPTSLLGAAVPEPPGLVEDQGGHKDPGRGSRVRSHRTRSQPRTGPYYAAYDPSNQATNPSPTANPNQMTTSNPMTRPGSITGPASGSTSGPVSGEAYGSQMQYGPQGYQMSGGQMGSQAGYLPYAQSGAMPYPVAGYAAGYGPAGGFSGPQFYGGWSTQPPYAQPPYGQYLQQPGYGNGQPGYGAGQPGYGTGQQAYGFAPSFDYYGTANHMMTRGFNPNPTLQPPATTFVGEPIIGPNGGYNSPHSSAVRLEENQFRPQ
ncbi:pentapeptide repeat protein [Gregarina niphandrodes]|uniref:Pentapeptide repeat protein n=1 Tax=Gregarina niphandrodes TaxID=110365 RepID=A0A023BAR8_GRENI|nr:pentapeptide repeat protein [Gregarina niphandrodes]EZG78550.1 pentapeptide repeat protein [Gregarina niphandrodes]|eukprot:XP_011129256.1 pentapeptide repeat protein [Gregarina niphandrodes]